MENNLKQEIDDLIELVKKSNTTISDEMKSLISDVERQINQKEYKDREQFNKNIVRIVSEMVKAFADNKSLYSNASKEIIDAINNLKIEVPTVTVTPPVVNVPDIKIPEIKIPPINIPKIATPRIPEIKIPKISMPDEMNIKKPSWLSEIFNFKPITDKLNEIKDKLIFPKTELPTDPRKPVAVRLSDGDKFYKAVGGMVSAIGSSFPFQDSKKNNKPALVNDDGSLNIKEISPVTPITGFSTSAKQDTQTTLLQGIAGMIPSAYDTIFINYTDSTKVTVSTYVFKLGAATVATITPTSASTSDTYTKT